MFALLILTWRLRYSFKNRGQQNKSHLILKYRFQAHAAELVFFSAFYSIFLIKTTILNDSCPSTFIPWLSGCSDLSCLEREEVFVLPGRMNGLGRRVDEGSRNMKRLWFFLAKPIFKIGSLNLFSTESMFRYREIWNFEACVPFPVKKVSKCFTKMYDYRLNHSRK